ncbi:MAG: hypothetical protein WC414_03890 [Patescibacteria group bacterium]
MKKIYFLLLLLSLKADKIFAEETGINQAGSVLNKVAKEAGVENQSDVSFIAGNLLNAILGMTGIIFLGLMVYAGILWMTARGDEGQIEKSKNIIIACVIGLMILVSAYAITYFIMSRFTEI